MRKILGGFLFLALLASHQAFGSDKATCSPIGEEKGKFEVNSEVFTSVTLIDRNSGTYTLFSKIHSANPGKYPEYIKFDLIKQVKETEGLDPDTLPVGLWKNYAAQVWLYFTSDEEMISVNTPSGVGTLWSVSCKLGVTK